MSAERRYGAADPWAWFLPLFLSLFCAFLLSGLTLGLCARAYVRWCLVDVADNLKQELKDIRERQERANRLNK